MFNLTRNGTTLKENLQKDNFFKDNEVLNIIDDYNIVDIDREAIDFYYTSFKGIGLRTINIFFQVKKVTNNRMHEIECLSTNLGIEPKKLLAFCVLLKKDFYPKYESVERLINTRANRDRLKKSLDFIDAMESIGIQIKFYPYESLDFKPPFHGRYWLTDNKGYIVDASLQTYGKGMVFAQLMDDENFQIIKKQLFDINVLEKASLFLPLDKNDLIYINNRIYRF